MDMYIQPLFGRLEDILDNHCSTVASALAAGSMMHDLPPLPDITGMLDVFSQLPEANDLTRDLRGCYTSFLEITRAGGRASRAEERRSSDRRSGPASSAPAPTGAAASPGPAASPVRTLMYNGQPTAGTDFPLLLLEPSLFGKICNNETGLAIMCMAVQQFKYLDTRHDTQMLCMYNIAQGCYPLSQAGCSKGANCAHFHGHGEHSATSTVARLLYSTRFFTRCKQQLIGSAAQLQDAAAQGKRRDDKKKRHTQTQERSSGGGGGNNRGNRGGGDRNDRWDDRSPDNQSGNPHRQDDGWGGSANQQQRQKPNDGWGNQADGGGSPGNRGGDRSQREQDRHQDDRSDQHRGGSRGNSRDRDGGSNKKAKW